MENKRHAPRKFFAETLEHWSIMSVYERFEQIVAIVLSLVISVVIALALVQLVIRVLPLLLSGAIDPLEPDVFQALFGMIMTLLIAMEFKHSIVRVALRRSSIIQVKTVVLIALIALSRKFVILDSHTTAASTIAALAGATLALGVVYWLMRERDDLGISSAIASPAGYFPWAKAHGVLEPALFLWQAAVVGSIGVGAPALVSLAVLVGTFTQQRVLLVFIFAAALLVGLYVAVPVAHFDMPI